MTNYMTNKDSAPETKQSSAEGNKKNILLIEDDTFMSSLLGRKLSKENYGIFAASDAQGARGLLNSNPVNLIILDIVLPGMDGFTFLKELKENPKLKDIPVMIASNLGQPEEIEKGFQQGAADYIVKANTTPGEIVDKVKNILEK